MAEGNEENTGVGLKARARAEKLTSSRGSQVDEFSCETLALPIKTINYSHNSTFDTLY